eukprot:m.171333 g.171333  ORF g.171333 m.171333 type:complete len:133 (-) comp15349_c1_seq1:173-571(-)
MTTMENANTSSKALADKGSRVTKMPAKAPTAEERFAKLKQARMQGVYQHGDSASALVLAAVDHEYLEKIRGGQVGRSVAELDSTGSLLESYQYQTASPRQGQSAAGENTPLFGHEDHREPSACEALNSCSVM